MPIIFSYSVFFRQHRNYDYVTLSPFFSSLFIFFLGGDYMHFNAIIYTYRSQKRGKKKKKEANSLPVTPISKAKATVNVNTRSSIVTIVKKLRIRSRGAATE